MRSRMGSSVLCTMVRTPSRSCVQCRSCPTPTQKSAADMVRSMLALYVGGMGAKGANFHFDVLARMGWEEECHRVQDLYLDGRKREAMAAIPLAMVEDVALVGPPAKIAEELPRWRSTVITTMLVQGPDELLKMMASMVL